MGVVDGVRTKGRLVDRYINTAYDIVKSVADNLPAITSVKIFIDSGDDVIILAAAAQTTADLALTNADVVLTNADLVLTNADVVLTNADVVLTGLDVVSTAADLVSVQSIYDQFDDRFLGSKATDPTLDNDSNALIEGAMYWNSVSKEMRVWNGTSFVVSYNALTGISDSSDAITIRIGANEDIAIGTSVLHSGLGTAGTWVQIGDSAYLNGAVAGAGSGWFDIAQNNYYDGSNYRYTFDGPASVMELTGNGGFWFGVAPIGAGVGEIVPFTTAFSITSAGDITGTCIKDDDTMADDSAVHLVTQQSVKAYVDTSLAGLKQKVIEIGYWDMDATSNVSVAHGLTLANIRGISALIRDDNAANYYDFGAINTSESSGHFIRTDSTNIVLYRGTDGLFDNVTYDAATYNRGWITIKYVE